MSTTIASEDSASSRSSSTSPSTSSSPSSLSSPFHSIVRLIGLESVLRKVTESYDNKLELLADCSDNSVHLHSNLSQLDAMRNITLVPNPILSKMSFDQAEYRKRVKRAERLGIYKKHSILANRFLFDPSVGRELCLMVQKKVEEPTRGKIREYLLSMGVPEEDVYIESNILYGRIMKERKRQLKDGWITNEASAGK